jgi:hypothetical protein
MAKLIETSNASENRVRQFLIGPESFEKQQMKIISQLVSTRAIFPKKTILGV